MTAVEVQQPGTVAGTSQVRVVMERGEDLPKHRANVFNCLVHTIYGSSHNFSPIFHKKKLINKPNTIKHQPKKIKSIHSWVEL